MSKNLDIKIFRTKDLGRHDSVSHDRHCLDHDRAIAMVDARFGCHRALWKYSGPSTFLRVWLPPFSRERGRVGHPSSKWCRQSGSDAVV